MSYKDNIWKMYAFKFLTSLHFLAGVLIPFFFDYGKITFAQIMLLQVWFSVWVFALEIPTGTVADYLGRKTSLVSGAVVIAIAAVVYTSYPNFLIFMLAEFLWAVSLTLITGADDALVYDSLKKVHKEHRSKKVLANISTYEILAITIASPIGSIIAATIGVRWVMAAMAIPALLAAGIGLTMKEPKAKRKVESRRYIQILVGGVKYLKNHKILRLLAFDSVIISAMAFMLIWTYQLKLIELKVPILFFGFITSGLGVVEALILQNFSGLEKLMKSKKRLLLWSGLLPGIFFILLAFSTGPVGAILAMLVVAGFGLTRERLFASYMNKYIESHHRATVLSCVSMLRRMAISVFYLVIAVLVNWSLKYTFIILGAAMIIFALISKVEEEHLLD